MIQPRLVAPLLALTALVARAPHVTAFTLDVHDNGKRLSRTEQFRPSDSSSSLHSRCPRCRNHPRLHSHELLQKQCLVHHSKSRRHLSLSAILLVGERRRLGRHGRLLGRSREQLLTRTMTDHFNPGLHRRHHRPYNLSTLFRHHPFSLRRSTIPRSRRPS